MKAERVMRIDPILHPVACNQMSCPPLFELQFASFHFEGVNGFAVDVHNGVLDRRILRLEIEIDPSKGLFLIVTEERGLDQAMHMLVGQSR
jgi:hypothetical protein